MTHKTNIETHRESLRLLQVVRAIAAVMVVWYHAVIWNPARDWAFAFGQFGVDLFFVLSGCIMAMLMQDSPGPFDFVRRRAIRILPLYWLATLAFTTVVLLIPSAQRTGIVIGPADVARSLFFIPYENTRGQMFPVLSVGWTLNFEVLFYACCAVALFIGRKHVSLVAASLVLCGSCIAQLYSHSTPGRFFGDPIVIEFIGGMLVWKAATRCRDYGKMWKQCSVALGVAALFTLPFAEATISGRVGPGAASWSRPLLFLPLAVAVVYAALVAESLIGSRGLRYLSPLVRIGDASYAIYLTHIFTLGVIFKMLPSQLVLSLGWWVLTLVGLVSSVAVGILVHHYVDRPLYAWARRRFAQT